MKTGTITMKLGAITMKSGTITMKSGTITMKSGARKTQNNLVWELLTFTMPIYYMLKYIMTGQCFLKTLPAA